MNSINDGNKIFRISNIAYVFDHINRATSIMKTRATQFPEKQSSLHGDTRVTGGFPNCFFENGSLKVDRSGSNCCYQNIYNIAYLLVGFFLSSLGDYILFIL